MIGGKTVDATMQHFSFDQTYTKWKSTEETVKVPVETDHFTLSISSAAEARLYFHKECFENLAGTEFTEAIENNKNKCLLCLDKDRSSIGTNKYGKQQLGCTCSDCAKTAPMCELCNIQMILRHSRKNKNIFFSCPRWPTCKNTRNIV